jgi:glutathione synthase/RimK-type ligase-like ATP-grasp enzyme
MMSTLHELTDEPQVFVIHENEAWVVPLRREFEAKRIPYAEWFIDEGILDLSAAPPEGVFYNRMSASSHTRGHRFAPERTAGVLAWLERHGRVVVNGGRALQLEVSKVAQYEALAPFGIRTPRTIAVVGRAHLLAAAEQIGFPVILKHNRAGKGLGVKLLYSREALAQHVESADFEESIDGITLVQQYIAAPAPFITRMEFVGGRFVYAVRVDTSEGFELCPADVCQIDSSCATVVQGDKFQIHRAFEHPLVPACEAFLKANAIGIAGIEFIADADGNAYVYDVNTNTNYNPDAEAKDGRRGMGAIASHLGDLLERHYGRSSLSSAA